MRLAVELYGEIVGNLVGDDARTFDFHPTTEGMSRFGVNSTVLSLGIPLVKNSLRQHAGRRRNWFTELLPEGDQYEHMLAQSGLRRGDTLGFLARYGRDVAGALQMWDTDDASEPKTPALLALAAPDVRRLLEDPFGSPLANRPGLGKSSLAGVQPKVVLVKTETGWSQALGGYPTTHIVKPQLDAAATLIFDEEYGSRLARRLGLAQFDTHVADFDGRRALVIERFDRDHGARVHQEDFSQVLGASGNQKYQEFGGVVTLRRVATALERTTESSDRETLARMVVLSIGVGNLDMHTKNLGLLHLPSGDTRLAPAYDVVPHTHLAHSDGRLALAVNGKYRHADVGADDLVSEFTGWGMRGARALVATALDELRSAVLRETPLDGAHPRVQDDILQIVERMRA